MDLNGVEIKPAEGMLAVKFVDDLDDDGDIAQDTDADYDGLLAIVVAVGPKVSSAKKGDTIITRPYARDALKLGDGLVMIDSYCVVGTIAK